jgi:ABC-type nitrate/sulfonate/bicarbonate transport system substrate-binding protein
VGPGPSHGGRFGIFSVAVLVVIATGAPSAFASSSARTKKHLSLSSITLSAPEVPASEVNWVAQFQGFFKDQGLDITFQPGASNAAQIASILAGSAQFIVNSPVSDLPAVQQGGPLRGIFQVNLDAPGEFVLTQAAATQYGVPSTGNSEAGALKQLTALKGSHISVGISNATSSSYGQLLYLAEQHGLTGGISCSTCDLNFQSVGTTAAMTAGIQANKLQSITNVPPVTVIPSSTPTVTIEIWRIPPETQLAADYMLTTSSMIAQHPDTVQAVVTAMLQAMFFIKAHPNQAEKDLATGLTNYASITSPEEQEYLFSDYQGFFHSPYPAKKYFDVAVAMSNVTLPTPNTVTYSQFVVTKFVTKAAALLHVNLSDA